MIIRPKFSSPPLTFLIGMENSPVQVTNTFRYLGVVLDNKLLFRDHINTLERKIARSISIIAKLRHYVPISILRKLYFALIHLDLLYGAIVWMSTYKSCLNKLTPLRNKALRLTTNNITHNQHSARTTSLYKQLEILEIADLCSYEVASFTHKFSDDKLPSSFSKYFLKSKEVHKLGTRQNVSSNFNVSHYNTARLQRSIKYRGVKIWQSLSSEIKRCSYKTFTKKFKKLVLTQY